MRDRMVKEGSVGLLILVGLGLFGFLILWLRGITFGKRSYQTIVEFANVEGMRVGASVSYRGVEVGRITNIKPGPNGVDVTIEIASADLVIPRQVTIEANQSGLVGETAVDITPLQTLPETVAQAANPLAPDCNNSLIICDGARLEGRIGVSFEELLRATLRVTELFGDPTFFKNVEIATQKAGEAAEGVSQLSGDLSTLTRSIQTELGTFSNSAVSVGAAADQVRISAAQASEQLAVSANQTTAQLEQTTAQANRLLSNIDNLVSTNRATLVTTLNNLSQTSEQLRVAVGNLTPVLNQVESSNFLANLETLSANAAVASANLRDLSNAANSPTNLLMLQQTLDSARATFQNAQKITSDLDELTGDPAFRDNLRNLVNGLGGLVSSTEQLQEQTEVAELLVPVTATFSDPVAAEIMSKEAISAPLLATPTLQTFLKEKKPSIVKGSVE